MKFNPQKTTEQIIAFIRDYYQKSKAKGAIIGLSGGKDSSVVAMLMVKSLGHENVIGVWLPCHSRENDKADALEIAKFLNIKLIEFDLTNYYDNLAGNIMKKFKLNNDDILDANINLKPRLRKDMLYYLASVFSKQNNGLYLVCGTSNKCERYVGYFTKGGDNVCDIAPIADLYVDEVIKLGDYYNMPYHIIHKTPDDGLSNLSDEEKLGFSYDDVKKVIIEEETGIRNSEVSTDIREKILQAHKANLHKFDIPIFYKMKDS